MSESTHPVVSALKEIADDPVSYVRDWKARTGRPVVGTFPMNFPSELIHAGHALPINIQESRTPITEGRSLLAEFYCGYTRSVADQAAIGELDDIDAFVVADHCVQLLGAVDVIRSVRPDVPVHFAQFTSAMDDEWSRTRVDGLISELQSEIQLVTGNEISIDDLTASIAAYNRNRATLREIYELRRSGRARLASAEMQVLVKSSMVMDIDEHTARLEELLESLHGPAAADPGDVVRLHLSGHFCHAPRPELLELIEESGGLVVDDDLYTGYRYISTDVPEDEEPIRALTCWYLDRNNNAPCPTRVTNQVDWDTYLLDSIDRSGAEGVVVLMAKFCEPHMLYYPELRKALDEHGVPLLLIETEHEGMPIENLRTRMETFIERIRRQHALTPA